jgi:hypothetical protein
MASSASSIGDALVAAGHDNMQVMPSDYQEASMFID